MRSFVIPQIFREKMNNGDSKIPCINIKPSYTILGEDIMLKGGELYAMYNEETGFWETNDTKIIEMIDDKLEEYRDKIAERDSNGRYIYKGSDPCMVNTCYLHLSSTNQLYLFRKWIKSLTPNFNYHQLDTDVTRIDEKVTREMYRSKTLKYKIEEGPIDNYEKLMSTLYSPDNRLKIEWFIGALFKGDAKYIEKFLVLYGDPGTGKSTVLDLIKDLFRDYYGIFVASSLANKADQFATEFLRNNPVVSIQDDGSLSKIDSPLINEIVSHKEILINEKNVKKYKMKMITSLIMATNERVDIHDTKFGITRRLIDVYPSGNKLPVTEYRRIVSSLKFELGAIADHCIKVYEEHGKEYFQNYTPEKMIEKTNYIRNFIIDNYDFFENDEFGYFTRDTLYQMYKKYCEETGIPFVQKRIDFGESMIEYFDEYVREPKWLDGKTRRHIYTGFKKEKFQGNYIYVSQKKDELKEDVPDWLIMNMDSKNKFDAIFGNCLAQYANSEGTPEKLWEKVETRVFNLDTTKLHYVRLPENIIVIDFDIKDEEGNKDFKKNLIEASKWPKTYAETSKSGGGIHLHYIYNGDIEELKSIYDKDIEIKKFKGNSALRRMVTLHNNEDLVIISDGILPKKEKKVLNEDAIKNDKHLRALIAKALRKEIEPYATKTSMDFIKKVTDEAYESGLYFDVTDMRPDIHAFANNSSHNAMYCIGLINKIHFKSDDASPEASSDDENDESVLRALGGSFGKSGRNLQYGTLDDIIIFDCEVFENLFVVCWKIRGKEHEVVRMINPKPDDIEELCHHKLVGFNNRAYDNHILYARIMGYNNAQLYELSQRLISDEGRNAKFQEAYKLSYTDIYDFLSSSGKMGLKKWEIKLHIHHQEVGIPWDKPVPKDKWDLVAEYCANDVIATEAVWDANENDWLARCILADLSGLTVNDTTNQCTTKLIVGNDRNPQSEFIYTDLSTIFPGYKYDRYGIDKSMYNEGTKIVKGKSLYLGEDPGEGGYVYAEPGIHYNVGLLDVASMHPHSAIALKVFGERYTKVFEELVEARVAIKHGDFEKAGEMLDGKLKPYLKDKKDAKKLANALKTAINSVYGLTSAGFDNKLRDPRNIDNIVAKYGALFMLTLKKEVQSKGYKVVHIKTDSIKIENMDDYICEFCMNFAKQYGFTFEHEATYEKMCIVNDAVYIAKVAEADGKKLEDKSFKLPKEVKDAEEYEKWCVENGYSYWTATGTQFAVPYVFKTLFAKEVPIIFYDYCETKQVTTSMFLDMNEGFDDVSAYEAEADKLEKKLKKLIKEDDPANNVEIDELGKEIDKLEKKIAKGHNYIFIGRVGSFVPVKAGNHGGYLMREQNDKYNSVVGTKKKDGSGLYRYLEAESLMDLPENERIEKIDLNYFNDLANDAIETIEKYGNFQDFVYGKVEKEEKKEEPAYDFMNIPEGAGDYIPFDELPRIA